jgi:hypothetical protein
LYWKRFFSKEALWVYPILIMGFIPAAILGFMFDDLLEMMLQAPWIPGLTLVVFGVVLLYIEKILPPGDKKISDIKKQCEIKDVNDEIQYITVQASKCLFLANEKNIYDGVIKFSDNKEIPNDIIYNNSRGLTIKYP